jgi:Tfp pilus assembly PilM family ATPase
VALGDVLKQSQADAKSVAFSIPLKAALMFNLKIPKKVEKSKLDETVRMEARKYIPVRIDEVQLD